MSTTLLIAIVSGVIAIVVPIVILVVAIHVFASRKFTKKVEQLETALRARYASDGTPVHRAYYCVKAVGSRAWSRCPGAFAMTRTGIDVLPSIGEPSFVEWKRIARAQWQHSFGGQKKVWVPGGPLSILHFELLDGGKMELGIRTAVEDVQRILSEVGLHVEGTP